MRDMLYLELRKIVEEIELFDKENTEELVNEKKKMIFDTKKQILYLADVARKEGILALEEEAQKIESTSKDRYFANLLLLIIDGTSPESIEDIAITTYYAKNPKDYDALFYLMTLVGTLDIQSGQNPVIINAKQSAFLPSGFTKDSLENQKLVTHDNYQSSKMTIVDDTCNVETPIISHDEAYFTVKIAEYMITNLEDRSIQRVLRDIDNNDLAISLLGFSSETRRKIFNNLSSSLAEMIAEDMNFMGPVRVRDVEKATKKMLNIIQKLYYNAQITYDHSIEIGKFLDLLEKVSNENVNQEIEDELYQIFKEYKNKKNQLVKQVKKSNN